MLIFMMYLACQSTVSSDNDLNKDGDGDGFTPFAGDCNDLIAEINPSAQEICDGMDNDCDEKVDDESLDWTTVSKYYADADGDSYGVVGVVTEAMLST